MTLGQLLRKARARLEKTQGDIAAELQMKQPSVSAWESDEAVPSLRDVKKVAKAYDVSQEDILKCRMPAPGSAQ